MILALETATTVASVAVVEEGKLRGEFFLNTTKTHSQLLMPLVDQLLRFIGRDITEMQGFAVAIGPGSFTGLRIGLATVKGMAQALGKPVLGVPTLDGLAHNVSGVSGLICPVLDARKNEVYTAVYESVGNKLKRLTDYMALSPRQLREKLGSFDRPVTLLGDAVERYQEYFADLNVRVAFQANRWPRAAQIACLAEKRLQKGDVDDLYMLAPLYIRRSEAEIRWEEKYGSLQQK
ncbi:MAG: tRNA (adenosine(37)-N6)-threonylcarbamoyltransferase complex dimerization subunit type 1 TsaB [Thermoanaerobacteraceae bacterium]|nr:tRNA (adenosine(37)-N6)-threonylcarbamoyltransferase complex dimerization subunit type 1 TsaB [Thermoanaerobacteraceae bacterium]